MTIDFMTGLSRTQQDKDSVWVIIDWLIKPTHFLGIIVTNSIIALSKLSVKEIVWLHGVPLYIISNKDPRFTSQLWKSLQKTLGTKIRLSSTFYPETNG